MGNIMHKDQNRLKINKEEYYLYQERNASSEGYASAGLKFYASLTSQPVPRRLCRMCINYREECTDLKYFLLQVLCCSHSIFFLSHPTPIIEFVRFYKLQKTIYTPVRGTSYMNKYLICKLFPIISVSDRKSFC